MQNVHFSPPELSRMLDVNESTVKRWVDKGLLKADKTPGGHRRVSIEDLKKFFKDRPQSKKNSYLISRMKESSEKDDWRIYYNHHVNFRDEKARAFLMTKFIKNGSVQKILDEIINPTLVEIGEAWMREELDIVDEHRMSFLIRSDLLALEPFLYKTKKTDPSIALACVPEENHEIILVSLSLVARENGFKPYILGINVPLKDIQKIVKDKKIDVLGLTKTYNKKDHQSYLDKVNKIAEKKKLKIIVGGNGWNEKEVQKIKKFKKLTLIKSLQDFTDFLSKKSR